MLGKVSVIVWWGKRKKAKGVITLVDLKEVKRKRAQSTARCEGEKDFSDLFYRVWMLLGPTSSSLFWYKISNTPRKLVLLSVFLPH